MRRGVPRSSGLFTGAPRSFVINWTKTFGLTRKKSEKLKIYLLLIFISYLLLDIILPRVPGHEKILIEKRRCDLEKFGNLWPSFLFSIRLFLKVISNWIFFPFDFFFFFSWPLEFSFEIFYSRGSLFFFQSSPWM